jgi:hypothetical protein
MEEMEHELDPKMREFEELPVMDRRPVLVNDMLIWQNPNDMQEWEKHVALWAEDNKMVRTMSIFDRATQVVPDEDKFNVRSTQLSIATEPYRDMHPDVHHLHTKSHSQLWPPRHAPHLRARPRSPPRLPHRGNMYIIFYY